jgi:hypothetical protein
MYVEFGRDDVDFGRADVDFGRKRTLDYPAHTHDLSPGATLPVAHPATGPTQP